MEAQHLTHHQNIRCSLLPHDKNCLSLTSWASHDILCEYMSAKRTPIHALPAKLDNNQPASHLPQEPIPILLSRFWVLFFQLRS